MAQETRVGVTETEEQALVSYRVRRARLMSGRALRFGGAVPPGYSGRVAKYGVRAARAGLAGKSASATLRVIEEMGSIILGIEDIANGISLLADEQAMAPGGNDIWVASQELSQMASRLNLVVSSFAA